MAAFSRMRRRPALPFLLLLVTILTCSVVLHTPASSISLAAGTAAVRNIYQHSEALQHVFQQSSSRHRPAPGWEDSLSSCRIADLPNHPLVKEYGQNNIRLSRTYEGSGVRVRQVLQKALRGEKIKIAVVGGSVSAGHAIWLPLTPENFMHKRIHRWFLDTFPMAGVELNLDSAIPATTAFYFSYCVLETVPEDADLVLVELDINHHTPEPWSLTATEGLLRTLLELPKSPAVIYMSVFALSFDDMTHGWRQSALIAQWLDIPVINVRNFLLPEVMLHTNKVDKYFLNWADDLDPRHINLRGHQAMGDMVIAYLQEQLCMLQREGPVDQLPENDLWPGNDIAAAIPRLGMLDAWSRDKGVPRLVPFCKSITSVKDPLKPIQSKGWTAVERNDKKSYEATEIGAEVTFPFQTSTGLVGFMYWRTKDLSFGSVSCWIDNDTAPDRVRRVESHRADWPASTFEHTSELWEDITPGDHTLSCKLEEGKAGGKIFRIQAVVTR